MRRSWPDSHLPRGRLLHELVFPLESAAKRGNLGDKSVAVQQRPFAVVEMTALGVPGAQHGAVVYRPLQRKIGNPAVALAHDRQEEAFRRLSRRRHLDDVARFIAEATWRHR